MAYAVGGGLYFVSGYIVFAICYSLLGLEWWVGKILGDIIGWTLNYLVQRYWAFNSKTLYKHEWRARLRYISFTAFNIFLDYLIVGALKEVGITPYAGMIFAAAFFTVWNYFGYRFWVFKGRIMQTKHEQHYSKTN